MKLTGKAVIKRNGIALRTLEGASLDPGGAEREPVVGYEAYGYTEKPMLPTVEAKLAHSSDTDLTELSADVDVTIIFETDTGDGYVLNNAWIAEPAKLDGNEVSVKYQAIRTERR